MARTKVFGSGAFAKARRGDSSGVFIVDNTTSFYQIAATNFPKESARALRHVSYLIMQTAKRYMANDGHGNPLAPITKSRTLDKFAGRGSARKKKFAGDLSTRSQGLQRAIKYDSKRNDPLSYLVGWASNDARRVSAPRFQKGQRRVMDDSMRRFLKAAALSQPERGKYRKYLFKLASLPNDTPIGKNQKERQILDPVFNKWQGRIGTVFEKRLLRNLDNLSDEAYTAFLLDESAPDKNFREAVEVAIGIRTRAGNIRKGRKSA